MPVFGPGYGDGVSFLLRELCDALALSASVQATQDYPPVPQVRNLLTDTSSASWLQYISTAAWLI